MQILLIRLFQGEQVMDEKLTNSTDLNKNGIPDWYESRVDDQTTFPEGALGHAYTSEEKIAAKIPNYKEYKWYQNPVMDGHPGTEYFYTLGEKLEKKIETNPKKVKQTLNKIAKEDNEVSKKDVQPLIKEAEQVTDGDERTSEVNNEVVNEVLENPKLEGILDNVEIPDDNPNNDEVNNEVVSKELPEGSDIQEEAEQLYDDNPNNDEVNNEVIENTDIDEIAEKVIPDEVADQVIPKEEYDAMPIDEIEKRDAESITEGKPYMAIAEDMGLGEEDLLYFEQPEFIEDLTPEQIEEVKNEPDKQKKIELLKSHYEGGNNDAPESLGSTGVSGGGASIPNVSGNFQPYDEFVTKNSPTVGSFLGGAGNVGVGGRGGSIAAGSVSGYGFEDKEGNSTSSEAGNGQKTNVEVEDLDANTASLNGANSVQHLDDSLDDLGFKDTKHNKEIKSNEQAELPNGEFHEKNKESFELKLPENPTNDDIISYLEKDSVNWKNGDSKSKYLPFRFFIKDGELWGTVIGHGRPEKIKEFMKHEILAKGKISNIIKGV